MFTIILSNMFKTLSILGRQPALSIAELERLLGPTKIKPVGSSAVLIHGEPDEIPFHHLGGTMKLCRVIDELPTTNWHEITKILTKEIPPRFNHLPEGKIKFGISTFELGVRSNAINATGLEVKKAARNSGRSLRVIPNNAPTLNSAQVLNNKLTAELGMELVLLRDGNKTILAQTVAEQDIDAYAARDQRRPMRDARVGMLPPKLAQIIINLSGHHQSTSRLLDPFCGTGVILQEALMMGIDVYGTDLEPRMIEYSQKNLEWLEDTHHTENKFELKSGDATHYQWQKPFDTIACETYLGRPFSTEPRPEKLREVIQDVDTIHRKFLQNVHKQTEPGFKMCIAVPAWFTKNSVKHLPILDHLTDMGYTRISFVHAVDSELIYHREDQIVGRELVVLEKR